MATLTYNYADSTVVVGPIARFAEPHTYDLCAIHANAITGPKGWNVLHLQHFEEEPVVEETQDDDDDLLAIARMIDSFNAQEKRKRHEEATEISSFDDGETHQPDISRRSGHLRVLRSEPSGPESVSETDTH